MSAHLIGYHDNIVILLGILSVALLSRGRAWPAAILQVAALLTNEISLVLVFPAACTAWFLVKQRRKRSGDARLALAPMILPLVVGFALIVNRQTLVRSDFAELYAARLAQFPFIREGRHVRVPFWVSVPFTEYFVTQSGEFLARITSIAVYNLVLPGAMAALVYLFRGYRMRIVSAHAALSDGVTLAPQLLHLVARDTARSWTYSLVCAFLALWVTAEAGGAHAAGLPARPVCLGALAANAVILTPLMDLETDRFDLAIRLRLYAPVMILGLVLAFGDHGKRMAKRLILRAPGAAGKKPPTQAGSGASLPSAGGKRQTLEL